MRKHIAADIGGVMRKHTAAGIRGVVRKHIAADVSAGHGDSGYCVDTG